jgi:hypothetical protein
LSTPKALAFLPQQQYIGGRSGITQEDLMSSRNVQNSFLLFACMLLLGIAGCATNPALQFSNYQFDPSSPLESRLVAAPAFVLDYLNSHDKVEFYQNYFPTDQERSLALQYLSLLPKGYQTILRSHLLGIYLIRNFTGSSLTGWVFDKNKNLYAFIAINSATLSTPISDWITFRDQSCFKPDSSDTKLSSDCGISYTAFIYPILHESSHVVDAVLHYHPNPTLKEEKVFPFIGKFWQGYSHPRPQFDFSQRKNLAFYGLNEGPKLPLKEALLTYRELSRSPFDSLYGSQTVLEDYAELFTWSYYVQVLHQQYSTTVTQGSTSFTYVPMDNPLVRERALALIDLYD